MKTTITRYDRCYRLTWELPGYVPKEQLDAVYDRWHLDLIHNSGSASRSLDYVEDIQAHLAGL
jgi:hypothetical protein